MGMVAQVYLGTPLVAVGSLYPSLNDIDFGVLQEFSIQNESDFPALQAVAGAADGAKRFNGLGGAATAAGGDGAGTATASDAAADRAGKEGAGKAGAAATASDRYGLLGLLHVIRMTDQDLTMLALGTDLTSLGKQRLGEVICHMHALIM